MPTAADVSLVCTNVRMLDGKKPIFVDHVELDLRLPVRHDPVHRDPGRRRDGLPSGPGRGPRAVSPTAADEREAEADLELDEDFLRRIRDV